MKPCKLKIYFELRVACLLNKWFLTTEEKSTAAAVFNPGVIKPLHAFGLSVEPETCLTYLTLLLSDLLFVTINFEPAALNKVVEKCG